MDINTFYLKCKYDIAPTQSDSQYETPQLGDTVRLFGEYIY